MTEQNLQVPANKLELLSSEQIAEQLETAKALTAIYAELGYEEPPKPVHRLSALQKFAPVASLSNPQKQILAQARNAIEYLRSRVATIESEAAKQKSEIARLTAEIAQLKK